MYATVIKMLKPMSQLKKTTSGILSAILIALMMLNISQAQQAEIQSQTRSATSYEEAIQKTRHLIDSLMTEQQIPGLELAVWHDGEIVLSEGFGFADLEHKVPVWPHTKMRIGSVSKTLTSAAVGKLYELGKLDMSARVQEYVPYFPEKRYEIDTRQVAGHIAGVRHYRGDEFLSDKYYPNVREGIQIFADDTLLFKPSEDYSYSSYGWNLVSAVVEGAAGEPFVSYM
jgi:CubicO group peptidase (beta-lactamase class C family)